MKDGAAESLQLEEDALLGEADVEVADEENGAVVDVNDVDLLAWERSEKRRTEGGG